MSDLISIITTCYNEEAYIAEAIESVLAQTHANWELLIFDDGSTDSSLSIIQSYVDKDARISLYQLQHQGCADAIRPLAIPYTKGEFVTFLDGDDYLPNNSLELRFSALNMNRELLAVFGTHTKDYPTYFEEHVIEENPINLKAYFLGQFPHENWHYLYKKSIFNDMKQSFPFIYGDGLFTYFFIKRFFNKIAQIKQSIYYYRQTTNSLTRSNTSIIQAASDWSKAAKIFKSELQYTQDTDEQLVIRKHIAVCSSIHLWKLIKIGSLKKATQYYSQIGSEYFPLNTLLYGLTLHFLVPKPLLSLLKKHIKRRPSIRINKN